MINMEKMILEESLAASSSSPIASPSEEKKLPDVVGIADTILKDNLLQETEDLLRQLESSDLLSPTLPSPPPPPPPVTTTPTPTPSPPTLPHPPTPSSSSLIILLQLILSTLRFASHPSSKLTSLHLLSHLAPLSTDESRLQRMVPLIVSLLDDPHSLVRATSIRVLSQTLSLTRTFPPSDAKLFGEYVFKRLGPLVSSEILCVRVAFAECIASLAETSRRFLDVSHAVRLYELVERGEGGQEGGGVREREREAVVRDVAVEREQGGTGVPAFPDDMSHLLGGEGGGGSITMTNNNALSTTSAVVTSTPERRPVTKPTPPTDTPSKYHHHTHSNLLIPNTYDADLALLHETISRWVVQITTDSSPHSTQPKLALLQSLPQLSSFFGHDGVTSRILPQILAFLNDRNGSLRGELCRTLPSVCAVIGRVKTEHFVVPCVETALVDSEESVVIAALECLGRVVSMGLVSRGILLTMSNHTGLLEKYCPLLLHPSAGIRHGIIMLLESSSKVLPPVDVHTFLLPLLGSYLSRPIADLEEIGGALLPPISRQTFKKKLEKWSELKGKCDAALREDVFQSVRIDESFLWKSEVLENEEEMLKVAITGQWDQHQGGEPSSQDSIDDETDRIANMVNYLKMVSNHRQHSNTTDEVDPQSRLIKDDDVGHSVPLSMAYNFIVPNQKFVELLVNYPPGGGVIDGDDATAMKSLPAIVQAYGLTMSQPSTSTQPLRKSKTLASFDNTSYDLANLKPTHLESKLIRAANTGEWGSMASLPPQLVDTSLLLTKLTALQIPPLPPRLGILRETDGRPFSWHSPPPPTSSTTPPTTTTSSDLSSTTPSSHSIPPRMTWKPRVDALLLSSHEHTAAVTRMAVSQDQSFFVSASHDGTSRVWEQRKLDDAVDLTSSARYSHNEASSSSSLWESSKGVVRLNDVCILENSHSVATAGSDGSVHVWRVDMQSKKNGEGVVAGGDDSNRYYDSRVVGHSLVRTVDRSEGEILAVNHFNTAGGSVLTYGTQMGCIHGWDLRCRTEPFALHLRPELGYLTTVAVGNDRNWMIAGTNRGCVALWDVRFHQMAKLYRHSQNLPIVRLATCFTTLPQDNSPVAKPFAFVGCGSNEAAVFDVTNGKCRQCFRVLDPAFGYVDRGMLPEGFVTLPRLANVKIPSRNRRIASLADDTTSAMIYRHGRGGGSNGEPSVQAVMGRIGTTGNSYIITGGSDRCIRYWDFTSPSRCYTVSGLYSDQPRPTYERVDVTGCFSDDASDDDDDGSSSQLFLCRQTPVPRMGEIETSRMPQKLNRGTTKPESYHRDAILDLKNIEYPMKGLLSCSRDGVVNIWR